MPARTSARRFGASFLVRVRALGAFGILAIGMPSIALAQGAPAQLPPSPPADPWFEAPVRTAPSPPPPPAQPFASGSSLFVSPSLFGGPFGPAGAPVAYTGPGAVPVHILGSGQLFQETANGWQVVCSVPCTTTVSPVLSYKLGGGLLYKDSRTFRFPTGAPLELVAKPASQLDFGNSFLGWTLIGLAPVPITFGALLAGGAFDGANGPSSTSTILGGIGVGAGVIMIGVGIYVLLNPSGTTLETASGQRIADAPRSPASGARWTPTGIVF
jgi:hypothetical protein